MNDLAEKSRSVLTLAPDDAHAFFLKHESYFNADLPPYFSFVEILKSISDVLANEPLKQFENSRTKAWNCDDVNHIIFDNKDGKLSWRPLQLIHPVLYVHLVREITRKSNWNKLNERFSFFSENPSIRCLSIPVCSLDDSKDRAKQVSLWWQEIELKSIELALDYDYFFETDIADCYGSIYTHSIAWAVETRGRAKKNRRKNTLGNCIDRAIQEMQYGQTNGIPQGSVLMDLIAEIVLGYIDSELTKKIKSNKINDYQILRYRDDYRVFVNNPQQGELILKLLSEVLAELGLRLNSNKTRFSNDVVHASVKADKLAWMSGRTFHKNLLKHCLIIKQYADQFPNSGSLARALKEFNSRVRNLKKLNVASYAVISTVIDIAYKNPRTYPVVCAILSKYISLLKNDNEKMKLIERIKNKFTKLPNVGYMEIWLQRATKEKLGEVDLNEKLCQIVKGKDIPIWNSDWIRENSLKQILKSASIIDKTKLAEAPNIIKSSEFDLFPTKYYW